MLVSPAAAETTAELTVEVYTYDPQSTPERQPYQLCEGAWTSVPNIDADYDNQYGGVVAGCQPEFVLVHYTGYVTFPESGTYAFMAPADDGFWMSFDGTPIITNDWVLKGRWGQVYSDIQIEGGRSYALDAWFYEYGGGANATLTYSSDNGMTWATVPPEFFTTEAIVVIPPVDPPVDPVDPPVDPVEPVDPPVGPVEPVDPVEPPVDPVDPPVEPVTPPVVPKPEPPVVPEPPIVIPEPPVVEPEVPSVTEIDPGTIDPTELTTAEVAELKAVAYETFETAVPGSEEYAVALEQLMVAAQADDIVVDEALAAIPLLGNLAVGLTDAFNFAGNIGADMSPKVREMAKKQVLVSVVAVGAAVQAAAGAATSAAAAASSSPSSRRK